MNINEILRGFDCPACKKRHACSIENVYVGKGVLDKISDACKGFSSILVVADENTFSAAGEKVLENLADKNVKRVIFPGNQILIPDEKAIDRVNASLCGVDVIVAVGSGVVQDLCKYVSFFAKLPYIVVATAPSMDGYASDGAAMILKGMKETVKAQLPKVIIADTDVLKNAPAEMIQAGYGDVVGKHSALCDWKLSTLVNGEYFCSYIYDTTYSMMEKTISVADGIARGQEESIRVLMEALVVVGIMMSFATSSRPASGSEHHLSHFFEIVGIVKGEKYLPHGIDVAFSTVITAKIREKILNCAFTDKIERLSEDAYQRKMQSIYGVVAEGCMALQKRVGNYNTDRADIYKQKEAEIRRVLSEMPSHTEIICLLEKVGLDMQSFYDVYSEEKIKNAISYAKDLKDRYTVLWLYYDMFAQEEL